MGKSGGGRGTNQYRVRGISQARHCGPGWISGEPEGDVLGLNSDQSPKPDPNGEFHGLLAPRWNADELSDLVCGIEPIGVERAVFNFRARTAQHIQSDAYLEGNTFTVPEVQTLLEGRHVEGHTDGEELMISDLKAASDMMLDKVTDGPAQISRDLSDDLHILLGRNTNVPTLMMRGDWEGTNSGPKVELGRGMRFSSIRREHVRQAFDEGVDEISKIEHPVQRGATWAAYAAYHQFYFDANKRTGRYVMNTLNLSHGYEAIMVRQASERSYFDALIDSYKTGDLTGHIRALLQEYPAGRRNP